MSLSPSTGVTPSENAIAEQIQRGIDGVTLKTPAEMAQELAAAYYAYSKGGTLPGADLTVGGTLSVLEGAFVSDNTPDTIDGIAQGILDYWATNNTPGVPAHGGSAVVSVVIDTTSSFSAMKSAINGIITDTPGEGWLAFYQATESVVKALPCTITELISGTPTPFPEVIT